MRLFSRKGAHPGFPVKFIGVDALHAAFLNESRTRDRPLGRRTGNPDTRLFPVLRGRKSGKWRLETKLDEQNPAICVAGVARIESNDGHCEERFA
jgi:hypothetical protein